MTFRVSSTSEARGWLDVNDDMRAEHGCEPFCDNCTAKWMARAELIQRVTGYIRIEAPEHQA